MDGALYGTTCLHWNSDSGSIFRMDLLGHVTDIHDFTGPDGGCPVADLLKVGGKLYGTTQYGGSGCLRCGVVFELSKTASGWSERVIYSFKGGKDGQSPHAGLTYFNGVFYGTTDTGGRAGEYCLQTGCGTVFSLTPSGKERVIHTYDDWTQGMQPQSRLIVLNGLLYGTTTYGGKYDAGTVFEMNTSGQERILWNFGGGDGAYPTAGMVYYKGYLYGTTAGGGGGSSGNGVIFKVDPSGKNRIVLCYFGGALDGAFPNAALTIMGRTFYGTTRNGGAFGAGTVFSVTPSGQGHTIYSFMNNQKDGWGPVARLTPVNGALYGTTQDGGYPCNFPGCGTVFKVTP